ncbi:MAG: PAS domain S-box protein [Syntrophorhabdus sp.]|nr:PAS domain S-box protein [Syntrophorhabdus sp.]
MDYTSTPGGGPYEEISTLEHGTEEPERSESGRIAGEAPALFTAFLENALDGVYMSDAKGILLYVNPRCEDITGFGKAELVGRSFAELRILPEEGPNNAIELAQEHVEGRSAGSTRVQLINKAGRSVPVRMATNIIKGADVHVVLGFLHDMDGHERADEALPESEQRFKDMSERSLVGMYILQDGVFKYANGMLARILGYEPDEMSGKPVRDVILPEDWPTVEQGMRKRISGELESLHYEFRVVTKDGEMRNVEVYSSRTVYGGRPAIIGTFLNITERKRAEEEKRHNERLTAALEMAGAICHELNQPLQVIGGRVDLLQMDSTDDRVQESLEVIRQQVDRMGTITRELMGLKKYSNRDYLGNLRITDIHQTPE